MRQRGGERGLAHARESIEGGQCNIATIVEAAFDASQISFASHERNGGLQWDDGVIDRYWLDAGRRCWYRQWRTRCGTAIAGGKCGRGTCWLFLSGCRCKSRHKI